MHENSLFFCLDDKIPYQSDSKMECKFEKSRKDLRKIYFSVCAEHSSVKWCFNAPVEAGDGFGGGGGRREYYQYGTILCGVKGQKAIFTFTCKKSKF